MKESVNELYEIANILEVHSKEEVNHVKKENYGQEAIFDLHNVDVSKFEIKNIKEFAEKLADKIGMKKGPSYQWGDKNELNTDPSQPVKADGISCVQFIFESSITVHALDAIQKVYINVFSCKTFDFEKTKSFVIKWFGDKIVTEHNIIRH